jgi:uncharacterized membrane protein (UPF0127 family)
MTMLALLLVLAAAAGADNVPLCVTPDGSRISLELAISAKEKETGLMYRDKLEPDRGMLFVFDKDDILSFWMKNTLMPLDIIWFDATGRVVDVNAAAQPCRADPCPKFTNTRPARAVLLVNAGYAAAHGLKPGAGATFQGVPRFPIGAKGI